MKHEVFVVQQVLKGRGSGGRVGDMYQKSPNTFTTQLFSSIRAIRANVLYKARLVAPTHGGEDNVLLISPSLEPFIING